MGKRLVGERDSVNRLLAGTVAGLVALGAGCAHENPVYSWSHPAAGEYLFAFDSQECEADSGADFFACMKSRGYFLVDPSTRQPVASAGEPLGVMEPGYTQAGR